MFHDDGVFIGLRWFPCFHLATTISLTIVCWIHDIWWYLLIISIQLAICIYIYIYHIRMSDPLGWSVSLMKLDFGEIEGQFESRASLTRNQAVSVFWAVDHVIPNVNRYINFIYIYIYIYIYTYVICFIYWAPAARDTSHILNKRTGSYAHPNFFGYIQFLAPYRPEQVRPRWGPQPEMESSKPPAKHKYPWAGFYLSTSLDVELIWADV